MALHTIWKHTPDEKDWLVHSTGSWDRVSRIDVPVLTVNGTHEPGDLIAAAERLTRAVPVGSSLTIEGVGHYANLEQPEIYNKILLDFLRTL